MGRAGRGGGRGARRPAGDPGGCGGAGRREAGPATGCGLAEVDGGCLGSPGSAGRRCGPICPGGEAPGYEGLGAPDLRGRPWLLPRGGTGPGGGLRAQRTPFRESGVSFQCTCLAAGELVMFPGL